MIPFLQVLSKHLFGRNSLPRSGRLALFCGLALLPNLAATEITFNEEEKAVLEAAIVVDQAFQIIAAKVRPAVVSIMAERPGVPLAQQGSGVIIDHRGYILTNAHVIEGAASARVTLFDRREFNAEFVGANPEADLAILRIQAPDLMVARLGDSDALRVGSQVMAFGSPLGYDFTVTSGIISAIGRSFGVEGVTLADFIQTDAPINPGNSGGPLVNLHGEVIGISTATRADGEGLGFAIPSNLANAIAQAIIEHRQLTRNYLGLMFRPLTNELARIFGVNSTHGALIEKVYADSPAAKAGLRQGDILVKYRGREVTGLNQLRAFVAISEPDEKVPIVYIRQGERQEGVLEVGAAPANLYVTGAGSQFLQDLGVTGLAELTPEILDKIRYRGQRIYEPEAQGVLVLGVRLGSEAARFLHQGSLITAINGQPVKTPADVARLVKVPRQGCVVISYRFWRYFDRKRIFCR